jgi:ribosomal protein S18 acetylase RimI-like enzyme
VADVEVSAAAALDLRPIAFDHPDSLRLIGELQAIYVGLYGDGDDTPVDPTEFAAPAGHFVLGYLDGVAVASGGWRAREGGDDLQLRPGDAEIKRMYVVSAARGRGFARAVLAELERSAAAAGRQRMVLETATLQPDAIGLYVASGYRPMPNFGHYRDDPRSRCYAKSLVSPPGAHPAL